MPSENPSKPEHLWRTQDDPPEYVEAERPSNPRPLILSTPFGLIVALVAAFFLNPSISDHNSKIQAAMTAQFGPFAGLASIMHAARGPDLTYNDFYLFSFVQSSRERRIVSFGAFGYVKLLGTYPDEARDPPAKSKKETASSKATSASASKRRSGVGSQSGQPDRDKQRPEYNVRFKPEKGEEGWVDQEIERLKVKPTNP